MSNAPSGWGSHDRALGVRSSACSNRQPRPGTCARRSRSRHPRVPPRCSRCCAGRPSRQPDGGFGLSPGWRTKRKLVNLGAPTTTAQSAGKRSESAWFCAVAQALRVTVCNSCRGGRSNGNGRRVGAVACLPAGRAAGASGGRWRGWLTGPAASNTSRGAGKDQHADNTNKTAFNWSVMAAGAGGRRRAQRPGCGSCRRRPGRRRGGR